MGISPKAVRTQLFRLRPLLNTCSLKTLRKGQDLLGDLMEFQHKNSVRISEHPFDRFKGAWVIPKDQRRQGVILYLHGGGYCCGGLDYATGVGALLATQTGANIFCAAYRLAPEAPFPAAVEDALTAYEYLLKKGYAPTHITLCGESAGGGLCWSLCLALREKQLPMPGGIIAISPWTDLRLSGPSYEENKELDPSMNVQTLDFYAGSYTARRDDPLASPLLGDLRSMPPSLIFVGGDEIMKSDAQRMHQALIDRENESTLVVKKDRWHGYLLYDLPQDRDDWVAVSRFLDQHLSRQDKLRWLRLDNAAKIYPAARSNTWSNIFRLSATLKEPVDPQVLQSALDVTVRRFPSIAARLRRGVFWYYLQQLQSAPQVRTDSSYPLVRMSRSEARKCALRVLVYENRIAVELFHSLTDGTGALIFLKSLVAEYLQQRHGIHITAAHGVLGRLEEPSEAELEDSFQKYGGTVQESRKGTDAWRLQGTPEKDGFLHLTCLRLPAKTVVEKAHSYHVSVTTFLCAALMQALQQLQAQQEPNRLRHKPIKVLLPVNLRNLFPSKSLRNFAMYTVPEILPRLGEYGFEEICRIVHHRMGLDITPKHMSMMIATNISSEKILALRLIPLFLKNIVMKAIFNSVGERKSCMSMSNLGQVQIPAEMVPFVERFDFILGVQATAPYNCGVISYGEHLYMNIIRNIEEPMLERQLYQVLRQQGIPVQVQSN